MSVNQLQNPPNQWRLVTLKSVVELRTDRVPGNSNTVGYVGLENVQSWTGKLLLANEPVAIFEDDNEKQNNVNVFDKGDVLFGKLRPYLAKAHLAQYSGVCSTELLVLKSSKYIVPQFLLLIILTKEFIDQVNAATFGVKMPRADWDIIRDVPIYVPPLATQRAIATFLDRETAKIDALVDAEQRLLALLTEKRQALITHAVTRGLNPAAPMQDSGVEWIGAVPGGWNVVALKNVADVRSGVAKGRDLGNRPKVSVAYVRVANVQDGYLNLTDVAEIEVLPAEIEHYSLHKGDVLMNEGGDADKLGRGAVWDGSISPCLHQNHVFAVRCFAINPSWLTIVSSSSYAKAYFESRAKQTTNLASISSTNLQELPVVLPPLAEQQHITDYINNKTQQIDQLITTAQRTIETLHERRTALISAAVTGQLPIAE